MTWTKLDDHFYSDPKLSALSDAAFRIYVNGLNWSVAHLTDGHVPDRAEYMFLPGDRKAIPTAVKELEAAGLWRVDVDGWSINHYSRYQPSKEKVERDKKSNRRRQALFRDKSLRETIRSRDLNRCRYCGREVRWTDRVGDLGGTYDHIDPEGDNTTTNIVVACRGCNSSKQDRTPDEAGMSLLPEPKSVPRSEVNSKPNAVPTPDPTRPDPKSSKRATKKKTHDEMVMAAVAAFGLDPAEMTEPLWNQYHAASRQLTDISADPDDIAVRRSRYRELHPDWECTFPAIVKYWPELDPTRSSECVHKWVEVTGGGRDFVRCDNCYQERT